MRKLSTIVTTLPLIVGFVFNIIFRDAPFNLNLNFVPNMQSSQFLKSEAFIAIMNICSNLFNPILCAGYVFALYLLSHRKFQLLVFLIWFIIISVFLSFIKMFVHQPRPYWIGNANIQMKQWKCYTQYGCPSGHSMLGLILIQFLIRFNQKGYNLSSKTTAILLILGSILQILVVFSRIILGMHSLNQVLFGLMLGFYFMQIYYAYVQILIVKLCIKVCQNKSKSRIIVTILLLLVNSLSVWGAFGLQYNNQPYQQVLKKISKCSSIQTYESFQYRCLKDIALIMGLFGILYGLTYTPTPQNLLKTLIFKRRSRNFVIRAIVTIFLTLIPLAVFMNPLWNLIELPDTNKSILIWSLNCIGLLMGTFVMVGVAPRVNFKLGLQVYHPHESSKNKNQSSPSSIIIGDIEDLKEKQDEIVRSKTKFNSIDIPEN